MQQWLDLLRCARLRRNCMDIASSCQIAPGLTSLVLSGDMVLFLLLQPYVKKSRRAGQAISDLLAICY